MPGHRRARDHPGEHATEDDGCGDRATDATRAHDSPLPVGVHGPPNSLGPLAGAGAGLLGADADGKPADPLLLLTAVGSYSSWGAGGGVGVLVGCGGGGSLVGCAATGVADTVGVAVGAGTAGVATGTVDACERRARR